MEPMLSTPTLSAHPAEPMDGGITLDELKMAYRCPGMPLDALRYDITPTGLHYQVVHFDIPAIDAATWRLDIVGLVERRLRLSLDDLRARPSRTVPVTLECAGNGRALLTPRPVSAPWITGGVGTAAWTGTPLRLILEEAGLLPGTVDIVFTGADHGIQGGEEQDYARGLPASEALAPDVLLAWQMNGRPLEPQHGFPVRLIVPGWYGMTSVKWLTTIEAIDRPFDGFQNAVAYRYQRDAEDKGTPVTRIRVKSLMMPPGIPEFVTERRSLDRGPTTIVGRAWSGDAPIAAVEVAVDGKWASADLTGPVGTRAWTGWSLEWDARPGEHELMCRATDASGARQPQEQAWNYQGMANNMVQRVVVAVR